MNKCISYDVVLPRLQTLEHIVGVAGEVDQAVRIQALAVHGESQLNLLWIRTVIMQIENFFEWGLIILDFLARKSLR